MFEHLFRTPSYSRTASPDCQRITARKLSLGDEQQFGRQLSRAELKRFRSCLNDQILSAYRGGTADHTPWLHSLGSMCNRSLAERHKRLAEERESDRQYRDALVSTVDRIAGILQNLCHAFNHTVSWKLHISCTPPAMVSESPTAGGCYPHGGKLTSYSARLSTSSMSLIIRGQKRGIDFFLIPAHKAIGLYGSEERCEPILSTQLSADADSLIDSDGTPLPEGGLERLCRDLFQTLVEESLSPTPEGSKISVRRADLSTPDAIDGDSDEAGPAGGDAVPPPPHLIKMMKKRQKIEISKVSRLAARTTSDAPAAPVAEPLSQGPAPLSEEPDATYLRFDPGEDYTVPRLLERIGKAAMECEAAPPQPIPEMEESRPESDFTPPVRSEEPPNAVDDDSDRSSEYFAGLIDGAEAAAAAAVEDLRSRGIALVASRDFAGAAQVSRLARQREAEASRLAAARTRLGLLERNLAELPELGLELPGSVAFQDPAKGELARLAGWLSACLDTLSRSAAQALGDNDFLLSERICLCAATVTDVLDFLSRESLPEPDDGEPAERLSPVAGMAVAAGVG